MMGVSLFIVWNIGIDKSSVRNSIIVFAIQLALNILWSYLFFGLQSPLLGLYGIITLWVSIVFSVVLFTKASKLAGSLLIPYLLWVTFAGFLNYQLFILNPSK